MFKFLNLKKNKSVGWVSLLSGNEISVTQHLAVKSRLLLGYAFLLVAKNANPTYENIAETTNG